MKNICIFTRTCDLRRLDATKITQYLTINGYKIVGNPKDADIIPPNLRVTVTIDGKPTKINAAQGLASITEELTALGKLYKRVKEGKCQ